MVHFIEANKSKKKKNGNPPYIKSDKCPPQYFVVKLRAVETRAADRWRNSRRRKKVKMSIHALTREAASNHDSGRASFS